MQATNISINPLESFSLVEVTDLLQQLTEVMKAEIEFLQKMRVREINPLQSKKHKLASQLEDCQRRFANISAEARAAITAEEKETYRDALKEFQDTSYENQLIISVAQEVNMNVATQNQSASLTSDMHRDGIIYLQNQIEEEKILLMKI